MDPGFLGLGISWKWVVNFTPRPLHPHGKNYLYQFDRRLSRPQSLRGWRGKKNFVTLQELELRPLGRPARSQSLYRLRYLDSSKLGVSYKIVLYTHRLRRLQLHFLKALILYTFRLTGWPNVWANTALSERVLEKLTTTLRELFTNLHP
jgi:hypothetical protein